MKSLSTFAVLAASIGLLLACQLQAKKPAKPNPQSDPHTVHLVMDKLFMDTEGPFCPIATSKGATIKPLLSGFCLGDAPLDPDDPDGPTVADFDVLVLDPLDPVVELTRCCVTVHNKKAKVAGVTFFFGVDIGGEPAGLHRTDFLSASASSSDESGVVVWTIHVNARCVEIWKEKGPGKGTVAGLVSLGGIVYTPK